MHKCPNCGQEFEGKFCPDCGAQWQEEKTCPQCGATLSGSAKFCNECGYSFTQAKPEEKKPSAFKQKLSAIGKWIKSHLKIVIPVTAVVIALIILISVLATVLPNKFRVGKVSKIELGYTHEQVLKILGEPYEETKEDFKWEYYDKNYMSVLDKIAANDREQEKAILSDNDSKLESLVKEEMKLEEQLESITYKYIEITFSPEQTDSNEKVYKVSSVLFDNARCDKNEDCKKEVKQIELPKESAYFFEDLSNVQLNCKYRYTDGSYKYCALNRKVVSEIVEGKQDITWEDDWGTYSYSSSFTVLKELSGKTKDFEWKLGLRDSGEIYVEERYKNGGSGGGNFGRGDLSLFTEYKNAYYLGTDDNPYAILCFPKEDVTSCEVNAKCRVILARAFVGCKNLTDIDIPEGVTYIGYEAFYGCENLTSITIPNGVTTIRNNTFLECSSLNEAVIPVSVTKIGNCAFSKCSNHMDIIYEGMVEQWNLIEMSRSNDNGHWAAGTWWYTIHCTDGDINN